MEDTQPVRRPRWWPSLSREEAPPPSPRATYQALRLLAFLRVFAPLAQALTLAIVTERFQVQVPAAGLLVLLVVQFAVAVATLGRLAMTREISTQELFAHAMLDSAIYTAVLYLTGGTENPFAPLFVLPMVIVASALPPRRVWMLAIATMAAYVLLRTYHIELVHPDGHTHVYRLHEDGMVVNYLITAALLAFFCNGMHAALRRNERLLADAREVLMRNDSVVAIGALAAGYAHELSSPLATVAVVTAELKKQLDGHPQVRQDLQLIADQIAECKRIVSNLASAGGERRAEFAAAARVDRFLEQVIERARALHPGATIVATLGGTQPPPMIVAEDTLRQAMMNLVQNAAQASPESVQVHATWSREELRVEVRDRGPGFPAEILARLGRQIESTKGAEGTGLGLLLSATTLERLGGHLEVRNEPDGGAHAVIRIPMHSIAIADDRQSAHGDASA